MEYGRIAVHLVAASATGGHASSVMQIAGHDFGEKAAERASRLGSAIRETVGKAKEQTEQVAHNLFPGFSGQKGSAVDTRGAADTQSQPSARQYAKDTVCPFSKPQNRIFQPS